MKQCKEKAFWKTCHLLGFPDRLFRLLILQKKYVISKNTVLQSRYYKIFSIWVTKDYFYVNKSGAPKSWACDNATQSNACDHPEQTSRKMVTVTFYSVAGKSGDTDNGCDRRNHRRQSRRLWVSSNLYFLIKEAFFVAWYAEFFVLSHFLLNLSTSGSPRHTQPAGHCWAEVTDVVTEGSVSAPRTECCMCKNARHHFSFWGHYTLLHTSVMLYSKNYCKAFGLPSQGEVLIQSVHSPPPIFLFHVIFFKINFYGWSPVHDIFHSKLLMIYLIIYLHYRKKCLKFNE